MVPEKGGNPSRQRPVSSQTKHPIMVSATIAPYCGIFMIRLFYVLCKLNQVRFSDRQWFEWESGKMMPWGQSCPVCGAKGCMERFGHYERYLVGWGDGGVISQTITVERHRCASCGHIHAILPSCLIPYKSYSLRFVLTVLRSYFVHVCPVEKLCEGYGISISTLYRWRDIFKRQKAMVLGALGDAARHAAPFLGYLNGPFLRDFYHSFQFSFLEGFPCTDKNLPSGKGVCADGVT